MAYRLKGDRLVRATLSGKHRVQRFDRLVRADQACCRDELTKELAAAHPVLLELLIAPLEHRRLGCRGGAVGSRSSEIETLEQIGPEIGHSVKCKPNSSD